MNAVRHGHIDSRVKFGNFEQFRRRSYKSCALLFMEVLLPIIMPSKYITLLEAVDPTKSLEQ